LHHSDRFPRDVLQRAWLLLFSVYVLSNPADKIVDALRRLGKRPPECDVPLLPPGTPVAAFALTIADLDPFAVETYVVQLDDWCQSALAGWQAIAITAQ